MKRWMCALTAICCLFALTGCAKKTDEQPSSLMLPEIRSEYPAPDGDDLPSGETTHVLWLPSADGSRLTPQYIPVTSGSALETATFLVASALDFKSNSQVSSLGGDTDLTLFGTDPVELSRDICTVNLGSSALGPSSSDLYTVALSLTATLCGMEQISAVNVLVADQSAGLDITGSLPMGTLSARQGDNLQVLWEQMDAKKAPLGSDLSKTPLTENVTVFYPLEDGQGITCKTETASFEGQTPQQMALGLLDIMSERSAYVNGVRPLPDLRSMMLHDPLTSELTDGGRLITISFREDLTEILTQSGTDLSCLLAAITYTMTTFIPGIAAICVRIAEKPVTSLKNDRFGTMTFLGGMMKRNQFSDYLTAGMTAYFILDGELHACEVPINRKNADDPREQMATLLAGPSESERAAGMISALPAEVREDDILGVAKEERVMLVNLSENFRSAIRDNGPEQEMLLCYSMVNTICRNNDVRKVCFFFEGEQVEEIAGTICWAGEFLYNPDLGEDSLG